MSTSFNPAIAYAAGALTILSPCVLPLVPIVLGGAAQRHRFGPAALAAGLVLSFTATGLIVATVGDSIGLDGEAFRLVGALALLGIGAVLLVPRLQDGIAVAAGPLAKWGGQRQAALERYGLAGQAGIGGLLGLVWSPCVGPTLGAATVLAAQGENLGQVALVMAAFGCGIATVLLLIGLAARSVFSGWRARMMKAGHRGKQALGALMTAVALLIFTGADHSIEGWVVSNSPPWLINLTTSI
jgi:cytochrome c biogenesis protein CcdA